jgi:hypothetical protein
MATSGQLVARMSEVLNISVPSMTVYDRFLRQTKWLSKAGRGPRGGVHRSPLDTARLLIAVLGTSSPGRCSEVVDDFGGLECHEIKPGDPDGLTLETLCGPEFGEVHIFERALEGLIAGFGRAEFRAVLDQHAVSLDDERFLPSIIVTVRETKVDAEISIGRNVYRYYHPAALELRALRGQRPPPPAEDAPEAEVLAYLTWADEAQDRWMAVLDRYRGVHTERRISLNEIIPIAELIHAPRPNRSRKGETIPTDTGPSEGVLHDPT